MNCAPALTCSRPPRAWHHFYRPFAERPAIARQVEEEAARRPALPRLCARLGLVEFWSASGKWPDCVDEVPYDFRAACEALRALPGDPFWR